MLSRLLLFLLWLAFGAAARAEWTVTSARGEKLASPGAVHRHLEVRDTNSGSTATLEIALFSPKSTGLRLIDSPQGRLSLAEAISGTPCVAGVNGGFFDTDFAPMGLRVSEGKTLIPVRRARLFTGILTGAPGSIQILRVGEYSPKRKISTALQCGPLLVDHGAAVKGLDPRRLARRTFAAVGRDWAALGFCSDLSLGQLAGLLAGVSLAENQKAQRAMNLDGGSSSAFWCKRENGTVFSIAERKFVRDFVGIVPVKP